MKSDTKGNGDCHLKSGISFCTCNERLLCFCILKCLDVHVFQRFQHHCSLCLILPVEVIGVRHIFCSCSGLFSSGVMCSSMFKSIKNLACLCFVLGKSWYPITCNKLSSISLAIFCREISWKHRYHR